MCSVESAGSVLPIHRLLYPCAPGGQTPTSCCLKEPPKVLLHGQRPQRPHDAWTLLLRHSQQQRKEEWNEEIQAHLPAPEPITELYEDHVQDIVV